MTDLFTAVGWSFGLTIDGVTFSEITKIEGIKLEVDVFELKTNSLVGQYTRKKLPGRMKSGSLTVTRAAPLVGSTTVFSDWMKNVFKGEAQAFRKTAVIQIFSIGGAFGIGAPVAHFTAINCWPTSIEFTPFEAGSASTMTEKIVMHHEGLYYGDPEDY